MAQIPDATALGERPTPIPSYRRPINDQSGQIIAHGIESLGEGLSQAVDIQKVKQDRLASATARSAILQADIKTRQDLENDPDPTTVEQRYTEAMSKVRDTTAASLQGNTLRGLFTQDTNQDIARGAAQLHEVVKNRMTQDALGELENTLEGNRTAALQAKDEGTRSALIGATQNAIDGAVSNGYLRPQQGVKLKQEWTQHYAEGYVAMQDTDSQLKILANPDGTVAQYLDPAKRAEMADSAQRKRIAELNLQYTMQERQQKQVQEEASKNMDLAMANHTLTPDWLEANRGRLSASDYRYGYKSFNGNNENVDLPTYVDLRDRVSHGEDIRDEARSALTSSKLNISAYDRLMNEATSLRPGWYKRGEEYISTMSGYSELNPNIESAQIKGTMLDQWQDWSKDHPKASEREAQIGYQDIVSHNMLIKQAGLPSPKFMVGSRLQPDIDASERATVEAYKSGKLNTDDFKREATLLKQWRASLPQQKQKASQ